MAVSKGKYPRKSSLYLPEDIYLLFDEWPMRKEYQRKT
jgi:hypothetical protein